MNPKYPIYIPSKGRWETRHTVRSLEMMGVSYKVVIEPHEFDNYASVIDPENILILPWSKPDSNKELVKARNWIKDHSISIGAKRHWQLDDNIDKFFRLNNNRMYPVMCGNAFRAMEDFVDRYENVAIAGPNYDFFTRAKCAWDPVRLNTRIYSCSLVLNEIPHGWRGVYNDDTDICLRVLKDGWCTVLFNAFTQGKIPTQTVKGGNTPIYQDNGRYEMAKSLQDQHPDVVTITKKWNRWQHNVNYKPFARNKLIKKQDLIIPQSVNNYGMKLVEVEK